MIILLLRLQYHGAADRCDQLEEASQFGGWFNLTPDKIHLAGAILAVVANIAVNYMEFLALERNGDIVDEVLVERGVLVDEPDIAAHAERVLCVKDGRVLASGPAAHSPCLERTLAAGDPA